MKRVSNYKERDGGIDFTIMLLLTLILLGVILL